MCNGGVAAVVSEAPGLGLLFFCQKIRTQLQNETDITLILIQRLKTKDLILDRVHRYFNPKQLCSAICKTQSFFMGSKPINKMYNDSVLNEWKS